MAQDRTVTLADKLNGQSLGAELGHAAGSIVNNASNALGAVNDAATNAFFTVAEKAQQEAHDFGNAFNTANGVQPPVAVVPIPVTQPTTPGAAKPAVKPKQKPKKAKKPVGPQPGKIFQVTAPDGRITYTDTPTGTNVKDITDQVMARVKGQTVTKAPSKEEMKALQQREDARIAASYLDADRHNQLSAVNTAAALQQRQLEHAMTLAGSSRYTPQERANMQLQLQQQQLQLQQKLAAQTKAIESAHAKGLQALQPKSPSIESQKLMLEVQKFEQQRREKARERIINAAQRQQDARLAIMQKQMDAYAKALSDPLQSQDLSTFGDFQNTRFPGE